MKKRILLVAVIALSAISMQTSKAFATGISTTIYNSSDNSMTFVENGITFSIFENGEFDFYLNSLSEGVNANYNESGVSISFNSGYDYDPYVQYDSYGAIIQIENTPIYYDRYGRIKRAGVININYNSGRLHRIGGLSVFYNSYGRYSHCTGYINTFNRHYVYHPYHNWFVRPYFGFTIVRVNPYRYNYNPYRYTYYRDHRYAYRHSRNRYDIRQQKRKTYNSRRSTRSVRSNRDYRRTASTRNNDTRRQVSDRSRTTSNTRRTTDRTRSNTRRQVSDRTRTATDTRRKPSQTQRTTRSTQRKPAQVQRRTQQRKPTQTRSKSRTAQRQPSKSTRSSSPRSKSTSSRSAGRRR